MLDRDVLTIPRAGGEMTERGTGRGGVGGWGAVTGTVDDEFQHLGKQPGSEIEAQQWSRSLS